MPDINEMMTSNYIKKEDLKSPTRLTINKCTHEDVGTLEKPEKKWVVSFMEDFKPLILNVTNIKAFARVTGDDNSDNWGGKQVVLFNDMTVEYQGKMGGVRVYQQMDVVDAPPNAEPGSQTFPDDEIPY